MKLVVPFTIPWMRSIGVTDSDASSTRTTGTTPATAASKRSLTPCARAVSNSSSPCWESSSLFALTTSLPARMATSRNSRAGSIPPISSRSRSAPARISSKLPRVRVSTPLITGRRSLMRSISSALCASSSANADPTVPKPSRPMLKGSAGTARAPLARGHHAPSGPRSSRAGRPRGRRRRGRRSQAAWARRCSCSPSRSRTRP